MSRPLRSLALAGLLALGACSTESSSSGGSVSTPADLARLVPANSTLFVQVASADELERFVREHGAGEAFSFDPAMLLGLAGFMGLDSTLVARDRPLGIAMAMPEGSMMPEITAVLPVTDADAFVSGLQPGQASAQLGKYVGLSTAAGYAAGSERAPIAALPGRVLGVRADLRALIGATRPMLDAKLEEAEQGLDAMAESNPNVGQVAGVMDLYFDLGRAMLDSLETLELGLSAQGQLTCLEVSLDMVAGSALARIADGEDNDLAEAAGRIDPQAAVSFLVGGDTKRFMDRLKPYYADVLAAYPESMRVGMADALQQMESIYPLLSGAMSGDVRFGEQGMSMSTWLGAKDSGQIVAKYVELVTKLSGVSFVELVGAAETVEVGGEQATRLRLDFDEQALAEMSGTDAAEIEAEMQEMMSRILGPEGVQVHMIADDDGLMFVVGSDPAFVESAAARLDGGSGKAGFDWVLERFGDASPLVAYRMDVPRLLEQMSTLIGDAGDMPELPPQLAGQSLPAVFVGGFEGRSWRAGLALDRTDLASFVAAMQGQ